MPHEYLEKKLFEAYKETEGRVYSESFYHALCHDNIHLIEILIDKGFDYTHLFEGSRSAVVICADKETFKALEYLLILSVRENNLFGQQDLEYVLDWALNHRHYEIIDLLLYTLKQNSRCQRGLINFIAIKDLLCALSEITSQRQDIPANQMLNLKNLIQSKLLSKRQMNYLYHLWSTLFPSNSKQGLEIYHWLADVYYHLDKERRKQKASKEIIISCIFAPALILVSVLMMFACFDVYESIQYLFVDNDLLQARAEVESHQVLSMFLLGALTLGCVFFLQAGAYLFYKSFKNIVSLRNEQFDRELLFYSRLGDIEKIKYFILKRQAHINVIAGIAETTPLYEAHRSHHLKAEEVLIENGGYSMQGNRVF